MSGPWLIWSNEHDGWWKPNAWGYTKLIAEAGRYKFASASAVCMQANIVQNATGQKPNETMVPAPEATPETLMRME